MNKPEEELRQYRKQIRTDVSFLMNTRLKLLKEFVEEKNKLAWNSPLASLSSVLWDSLFDNLIVTLSWLYSSSSRDKRSLVWYLKQVRANAKVLSKVFSDDELNGQFARIEAKKEIIEKVKTVRDKWVGHRDPIAFNNPEKFLKDHEINLNEFESLIKVAEEIINEHFARFEEIYCVFDLPINGINLLVKGEKARVDVIKFAEKVILLKQDDDAENMMKEAVKSLLRNQELFL
jgi:hypothetical protein